MLLNVTVDTVELKGTLNNFDARFMDQFWNPAGRSKYYLRSFTSKASNNIFLYIGLSNNSDRFLDFKIKIGSVALNTIDLKEVLETVPTNVFKIALVDIALDYDNLKMSDNMFTIFKKSKQIINNRSEIIQNVERGYKFFKADIVTGYVWGDRSRLYVRAYNKIEEIQENKNYVKEKFIQSYNSETVYRIEFSVRGKFKDYDLLIKKNELENINIPSFYIPNVIDYIEKKVRPGYYGKKSIDDLKNQNKIFKYQMSKSLRVCIDDELQLNHGIGNIKSYLQKKFPDDPNVLKFFMESFNTFLNKEQNYYDILTEEIN